MSNTNTPTENKDGIIFNLSNFKKLFNTYNRSKFNGGLTSLARSSKVLITNWHIGGQWYNVKYNTNPYGPEVAPNAFILYSIIDNHIQIMDPRDNKEYLKSTIGLNDNTALIKYLVEEFIMDFVCYANRETITDLMTFKRE